MRIQHPDDFISGLLEEYADLSLAAFRQQVQNLKNPPIVLEEVLENFQKCGLEKTAQKLKTLLID